MSGGAWKSSFSPELRGTVIGHSDTVGSTLWGMAAGVAVILDIVLGPVKIVPVILPAPAGGGVVADV